MHRRRPASGPAAQTETSRSPAEPLAAGPDFALVGSALSLSRDPVASPAEKVRCLSSTQLTANASERAASFTRRLRRSEAGSGARTGYGVARRSGLRGRDRDRRRCVPVEVERVGARSDMLLGASPNRRPPDTLSVAIRGLKAERRALAAAGVLAAVVDDEGHDPRRQQSVPRAGPRAGQRGETRFGELVEVAMTTRCAS